MRPPLTKVADRHGATVSRIALAWLLAASPTTLAIPGTGSLTHLKENVAAGSIPLTDEAWPTSADLGGRLSQR
ncbi:aldo/keto reductase [Streptomyces phaeoluteigriseus]|uniref:aldo/keto reductase n=1 Tax=Streptomyces phaeoluteigriseus TaxID=114686 RepID=UPI001FE7ECC7|nr:aldo/keto reductase [Streptomyces phaeoluteigriseus]